MNNSFPPEVIYLFSAYIYTCHSANMQVLYGNLLKLNALSPFKNICQANDDDAERAQHRRSLARSSTQSNCSLTSERLDEEQQGLKKCLQIFHENVSCSCLLLRTHNLFMTCRWNFHLHANTQKISKANAWQLTLIDNMANLCRGHHKSLKNFQIVGSSLEATTKIYGLRVDSVHSDIVRMSSGLGRMKGLL